MLPTLVSGAIAALTALYILYRHLLPKPIKGIPYNKEATQSLLGDIPTIQKESPGDVFSWIANQSHRHGPVFQLWLGLCHKPTVFITDFREGQDILMRRKEFDRAAVLRSVLGGEARSFHVAMPTGPQWKARRRLLQDLMGPTFLHNVAAPNIYNSVTRLLDLWKKKVELADGRPFSAEHDMFCAALDAVIDFGFGKATNVRALTPQIDEIESLAKSDSQVRQLRQAATDGKAMNFPIATISPALESLFHTVENVQLVAATGFPKLAWMIIGLLPHIRRRRAVRDELIVDQVLQAKDRFNNLDKQDNDKHVKSAIDLMISRQHTLAQKDGEVASISVEAMRDEIIGFVVAGHDTTSTTMCWAIKFLSSNPDVQKKLLESLRNFHTAAVAENRPPTYSEICKANIPYLEAVAEESLRLAHTAVFQDRDCLEDTVVLGHYLPKGTHVMIINKGPSFTEPGLDIEESIRSPTCQAAAKDHGVRAWEKKDIDKFDPERWLKLDNDGKLEFNQTAGPALPFGLGLRGCFGRKLAYMELRLLITLLVWTFEFQSLPKSLSSFVSLEGISRKPEQCYVRLKIRS